MRSILAARGVELNEEGEGLFDLETGRWYRIFSNRRQEGLDQRIDHLLHDRMTECPLSPPKGFDWGTSMRWHQQEHIANVKKIKVKEDGAVVLPLKDKGEVVLKEMSERYGLGLGAWEIDFLRTLFLDELDRDPTEVEIFDVAQSLSEHCRHWTFDGR